MDTAGLICAYLLTTGVTYPFGPFEERSVQVVVIGVGARCRDFSDRVLEVAMRRRLALTRHDLNSRLQRIDVEGWDGPTARELLEYVRENLVRIQVRDTGLSGPAADQAEATGWAVAWELLTAASIRTAQWPWSLLWISVRRAVRGEWASGVYLTKARTAWELRQLAGGTGADVAPLSMDQLVASGYDLEADAEADEQGLLAGVVELLVEAGWECELAADVVVRLALTARPGAAGAVAGWRRVAVEFGLPPWQVHRVVVALQAAARSGGGLSDVSTDEIRALCAATARQRGEQRSIPVAS